MPENEEITVSINGTTYGGWKSAQAVTSLDALCGTFTVSLKDKWGELEIPREIKPGDACQVFLGSEPVITGFVDEVAPSIDPDNHAITISGRDKTCDLVDCSAEVEAFELHDITLDILAQQLCGPFGIEVKVNADTGEPFDHVAVQVGESGFDCLERAAKARGILCTTDGEGALVLSERGVFTESGGRLVQGVNIKKGSGNFNFRDRFSFYRAHGQMPALYDGANDPLHNEVGEARDTNMMRYRPLFLTCEMFASCDDARIRAENECAYRAGRSTRANIQTAGWRAEEGGDIWRPGHLVTVESDALYLPGVSLVISTVRYSYSDTDGTITELELTRPDAYLQACTGEVEKDFHDL